MINHHPIWLDDTMTIYGGILLLFLNLFSLLWLFLNNFANGDKIKIHFVYIAAQKLHNL